MIGLAMDADEVSAVLSGRKTQFRRLVDARGLPTSLPKDVVFSRVGHFWGAFVGKTQVLDQLIRCPFDSWDQHIFVQEQWRTEKRYDHLSPGMIPGDLTATAIYYEADAAGQGDGKLRPARFLPSRFSRLTLKIKRIWVHRLVEIGEDDARAEGPDEMDDLGFRERFLQQEFNRAPGNILRRNPWLWACEFEVQK